MAARGSIGSPACNSTLDDGEDQAGWKMRLTAGWDWSALSLMMLPPVLLLRSNFGKLLLATSSLMRCPGRNTLAVAHRLRLSSYRVPGSINSGALGELR